MRAAPYSEHSLDLAEPREQQGSYRSGFFVRSCLGARHAIRIATQTERVARRMARRAPVAAFTRANKKDRAKYDFG
jgi:hypothetical protein